MLGSQRAIGTCGACGGAVCVASVWLGVEPPTPQCVGCGRFPVQSHGPVMAMQQAPRTYVSDRATTSPVQQWSSSKIGGWG